MLTYDEIKHNRRKFLALTGLTPDEFQLVLPAFDRAYARRYPPRQTMTGTTRQRRTGGGRKSVLDSPEQKLLFALVYLKAYPLQVVLGQMFGLSQASANTWLHRLLPILRQALQNLHVRPARHPHELARHERRRGEPRDWIMDGTERRRQRPKNKDIRDSYFSAHKKMHSYKNLVITNRQTRRISFLSQTYRGRVHDKKIANSEPLTYPRRTTLRQDTAFIGYAPRGVEIIQPKKSQRSVN